MLVGLQCTRPISCWANNNVHYTWLILVYTVYMVGSSWWFTISVKISVTSVCPPGRVVASRPGSGRHPPHRPVWRAVVPKRPSCPTQRLSRSFNERKVGFWQHNLLGSVRFLGSISIYKDLYIWYIMIYLQKNNEWMGITKVERRCSAPFLLKMLLLLWCLCLTTSNLQKKPMRCGDFLLLGFVRFDDKRAWPHDCHSKGSNLEMGCLTSSNSIVW